MPPKPRTSPKRRSARVHASQSRLRDPDRAASYLYSVAFNLARSRWRRQASLERALLRLGRNDDIGQDVSAISADRDKGLLSLDGGRLAFAKPFAGAWDLYTLSRDGTDQLRVTHDAAQDAMPAWSPDATMIAFARGEPAQSDLYMVAADGSSLDQLTDLDGWENAPTSSPDGTRIAFIRGDDDVNGWGHSGELWVINRNGTGLSLLRAQDTTNPAWSPDGTRIAFDNITGDGHLGMLDLATGAVTDLGEGFFPRWSLDGTRLVLGVLDPAGGSNIYTMAADGTNRIQLTDDPAFDTAPQWSPDGATILYGSRPADAGE
ncbi:MAG: hypothetical protein WBM50_13560 [Acidimicrobiales bacterium]